METMAHSMEKQKYRDTIHETLTGNLLMQKFI